MPFCDKLEDILLKYKHINAKLTTAIEESNTSQITILSKERMDMIPLTEKIREFFKTKEQIKSLEQMKKDSNLDKDMLDYIQSDFDVLTKQLSEIEESIKIMLLPVDEADSKSAIMEIRQGVGGDEAGLFGKELMEMYCRYAVQMGWKVEIMSSSSNDAGGLKEAICLIKGKNVFSRLKFESGTHRIQRVPKTETNGRLHTSTVTLAVLPEAQDININVQEKDIKIDVFRSSGPGGQSVNTTDSAVRITHLPTGLVVSQQDEKSQIKNREKAKKILYARLYDLERTEKQKEMREKRQTQIGRGDRSEKVRTYNIPQNRITDHRIGLSIHDAEKVIKEGKINSIIDALISAEKVEQLSRNDS